MFTNILKLNYFDTEKKIAEEGYIKNDRLQYKPIFDMVYKISEDNENIILEKRNLKDPQTDMAVYTTNAIKLATYISNRIHDNFGKYVSMSATLPNQEYSIMYNMRRLLTIYQIEKYKKLKISVLFSTEKINKIQYFPPNVELIDIYHKLYLPQYNESWKELKRKKQTYKKIVGGVCVPCKKKRQIDINNIKSLFVRFLHNTTYVLIGEWAYNLYNKKSISSDANISIISENDVSVDYANISSFMKSLTMYGIYYKKRKLYIPKDRRLIKHTFYIKFNDGINASDKPFLDIYNSASYELIPYTQHTINDINVKIANTYVLLRFLYIDLWLINLVDNLVKTDKTKMKINKSHIKKLITLIQKQKQDDNIYYTGIFVDNKIAQKIEISQKQLKRSTYYPELSMRKEKKYEVIATSEA